MKTVFLGDTHGRTLWKDIVERENPDRVIFLGDYFDSRDNIPIEQQVSNFLEIMEYKKSSGKEVVCLIGNHDHHYFPEVGYSGTSGYQHLGKYMIEPILDKFRNELQIAYGFKNVLCTHAGVSPVFMNNVFGETEWTKEHLDVQLNEMFRYRPLMFSFSQLDYSGYGDHESQSPIWIRPMALLRSNKLEGGLKKDYIQVVGHTTMTSIDPKAVEKAFGGRYYFVDTLGTSGEYLVYENDEFRIKK